MVILFRGPRSTVHPELGKYIKSEQKIVILRLSNACTYLYIHFLQKFAGNYNCLISGQARIPFKMCHAVVLRDPGI